jgi:hypothetical protein
MENFIPFKICNLSLRFVIEVKAKTIKQAKDIIETKNETFSNKNVFVN